MSKQDKIYDDKVDKMDDFEKALKSSYQDAELWIYKNILDNVLPKLDRDSDGVIKNTASNLNKLTASLNVVFEKLGKGKNKTIIQNILKDFNDISKLNSKYFLIESGYNNKRFSNIKKGVDTVMRRSLGILPNGKIKPKSFIASLADNSPINTLIRETITRNIQGQADFDQLTTELKEIIVTNDESLGAMNRYYKQTVTDKQAQYDRAESTAYANDLDMSAFVYAGGKVADTRDFCCKRNRLVFLKSEAQKWTSIKFQGKNKGYTPLIDLGGYNCRHSTKYISNFRAAKLRKDLELDEKGNLRYKKGVPRQRLNKCV